MNNFRGETDTHRPIRLWILVIEYNLWLKVPCWLITVIKQNYVRQVLWMMAGNLSVYYLLYTYFWSTLYILMTLWKCWNEVQFTV